MICHDWREAALAVSLRSSRGNLKHKGMHTVQKLLRKGEA